MGKGDIYILVFIIIIWALFIATTVFDFKKQTGKRIITKRNIFTGIAGFVTIIEFILLSYINETLYKNVMNSSALYVFLIFQPLAVFRAFEKDSKILIYNRIKKNYQKVIIILLFFCIAPISYFSIKPEFTFQEAYEKVKELESERNIEIVKPGDSDRNIAPFGGTDNFVLAFYSFDFHPGTAFLVHPNTGKIIEMEFE
ncbi:hypothetical protein LC087_00130 [Bacillus carboniphilus]|uniref:Uncharacterized protein n=1 Tax=Bacillus carboniphilus TaxID=86663 RepID=A0ABY9JTI1_9BACI|nr:hypothetical protein [Bacillus carboniphilus]WLR42699.1 hypothetical protein LC087_00130 [Bacillus carboniphilus]